MKITIRQKEMENNIKDIISQRANAAIMSVYEVLKNSSIYLVHKIATSSEWNELTKGRLIGEFGFTPYETSKFNEALMACIPSINDKSAISNIEVFHSGPIKKAVLNWIDWQRFAWSEFGRHDLTRLDTKTKQFVTIQTVSWLEWLEEGVIVMGFDYQAEIPFAKKFFSRSGQGLMKEGTLWSFAPTKLFERTANTFDTIKIKEAFVKAMKSAAIRI